MKGIRTWSWLLLGLALLSVACRPPSVATELAAATPLVDVVAPRFVNDIEVSRIERFDPPGAGADLELQLGAVVRNPNEFAVTLERVAYTLRLAGRQVVSEVLVADLYLPPLSEAPIAWTVLAPLGEHPGLWGAVVQAYAGEPLPFEVRGELRFLSEAYAFTSGVRSLFDGALGARQTVRSPSISAVTGESQVIAVRPDAPVVRVRLEASNAGDVGYFLSARGLSLALGVPRTAPRSEGTPAEPAAAQPEVSMVVGTATELNPVPVPAGGKARFDLLVYVDPDSLSPLARTRLQAALTGVPTPFHITGAFFYDVLGVDSFALPDDLVIHGVLQFETSD